MRSWRWRRSPMKRAASDTPIAAALTEEIARGRKEFASNWADQWSSSQYPLRPERILSELRRAAPADAFIVTDVGWNKNGVGQQFPIDVPGTFITPSGLATMGFGPAPRSA
jgi:acetolactate synthase-1/2/3 large subunit